MVCWNFNKIWSSHKGRRVSGQLLLWYASTSSNHHHLLLCTGSVLYELTEWECGTTLPCALDEDMSQTKQSLLCLRLFSQLLTGADYAVMTYIASETREFHSDFTERWPRRAKQIMLEIKITKVKTSLQDMSNSFAGVKWMEFVTVNHFCIWFRLVSLFLKIQILSTEITKAAQLVKKVYTKWTKRGKRMSGLPSQILITLTPRNWLIDSKSATITSCNTYLFRLTLHL